MTHVFLLYVLTSTQQHVDAVLPDGKMLTRDCVHIGRQLGPHYVEEKLVVLSCLHSHVFVLAVRAASCAVIVCRALTCAGMYSLKLIQLLVLQLPITVEL